MFGAEKLPRSIVRKHELRHIIRYDAAENMQKILTSPDADDVAAGDQPPGRVSARAFHRSRRTVHTEHQAHSVTVDAPLLANSIVAVPRRVGVEAEAGKHALSKGHNEKKLANI